MGIEQILTTLWLRKIMIFLIIFVTFSVTLGISLIMPKQYVSSATVMVDQRAVDPITGMAVAVQLLPSFMSAQTDIINSHNVARKVMEKLRFGDNEKLRSEYEEKHVNIDFYDWAADIFKEKLTAKASRDSNAIDISYTATDPKFAAAMANAYVDAYIETSVELRVQPVKITADWFESQLVSLRQDLENARHRLSDYQQQYRIVMNDERLDIENQRLVNLSKLLVESEARTDELESKKDSLSQKNASWSEAAEEIMSSSLINSLKTELAVKEGNLAFLSQRVNKNHPQFKQAEAEVNSLQKRLATETQKIRASMASGLSTARQKDSILTKEIDEQKNKILEMKKQRDALDVLVHEVDNAQKTYDVAMQTAVQMRMSSEINHTEISILNKAVPANKPSGPKIVLNCLVSLFLGTGLGVGAAILRELNDRRIRSEFDVESLLELPALGVISGSGK